MTEVGRAVIYDGAVHVVEQPTPRPGPEEALIALRLAGICQTDLELMHGYKGFRGPLGHEFVGEVLAGPDAWRGRRVVGEINIACGTCDQCRAGVPSHCRARRILGLRAYDGAFADRFRLPVRNLWAVPDSVPDEGAVFVEPLAAACQIAARVPVRPTDRMVVIGAGKLGLLCAQVLRLSGADLRVVVRQARPAELLARWGISAVRREDLPDGQADLVVDCTGTAEGFASALALVRPRGTLALKSTYAGLPQADLSRIVVDEIHVVGSRCGPFDVALRLLAQGLVEVTPLIEARYGLDDAPAALEYAARPGTLKVLLDPRQSA